MQYVVGIDGGGTKTKVNVLFCATGKIVSQSFGAMNLNGTEKSEVEKTIAESLEFIKVACNGLDNCKAICVGSAGISNNEVTEFLEKTINACGYFGKLIIVGDHETAHAGALSGRDGAVLIAGTGSVCIGKKGKTLVRSGGFGHLIDDEGSGYAIGRDVLCACVRAYDKRISPTVLTDMVMEKLNAKTINDVIKFVYDKKTSKKDIANLAPLLTMAVAQKDLAAKNILKKAADELCLLATNVIKKAELENGELSFLGSVILKDEALLKALKTRIKKVHPGVSFVDAENDAAMGAALIALAKMDIL